MPGTHKSGKVDIPAMVKKSGSEQIREAVPMVCDSGDVIISNRQLVHGSFANSSSDRRVTLNAGFFPHKRVLGVSTSQLDGIEEVYTAHRIYARSRIIALAINARQKHFPNEVPFAYAPFKNRGEGILWNENSRESLLKNYNLDDMYI